MDGCRLMSRDGSITLEWADGEYRFRLAIGQLRELQEKLNAGPLEVLNRLRAGLWRVDDMREAIRLGLIGGGATPDKARALIRDYVDARPLAEAVYPACLILMAAIYGAEDEAPGKTEPAETTPETTGASASPASTD